jgi:hypothetical protein
MNRRGLFTAAAGLLGAVGLTRRAAAATPAEQTGRHRLALHVDRNDTAVMNLALGNAHNAAAYYRERGESVALELVAYGPGLTMLRADRSPVAERIAATRQQLPQMVFSACNNTLNALRKAEGKDIPLLPEATIVPAGIVRLIELQEQGWTYVKP